MNRRREDHALWMLVGGALILSLLLIGVVALVAYSSRQVSNQPATKPVESYVTPPVITHPVETTPVPKPRKRIPRPQPLLDLVVTSAPVSAERLSPPDCAGQTGHNFGPCPGYVSPARGSLQSPGDGGGTGEAGGGAAASSSGAGSASSGSASSCK